MDGMEKVIKKNIDTYGWNFSEVKKDIDAGTYLGDVTDARAKLKEVQLLFPLKLSEAEPKKN